MSRLIIEEVEEEQEEEEELNKQQEIELEYFIYSQLVCLVGIQYIIINSSSLLLVLS